MSTLEKPRPSGRGGCHKNPEPDFWHLVREAEEAISARYNFDLDSSNEASAAEYDRLCREANAAALALIDYVIENETALRRGMLE